MLSYWEATKTFLKKWNLEHFTSLFQLAYKKFLKVVSFFLILILAAYRTIGTMFLGGACRFSPSCSDYADQALSNHNPFCATKLILKRIIKCHPFGPFGIDPLPARGLINE